MVKLLFSSNSKITADGAGESYLKGGVVDGVFSTVDFGPTKKVKQYFELQQNYSHGGTSTFCKNKTLSFQARK